MYGRIGVVQVILSNGANINIKNFREETPLHNGCNIIYLKLYLADTLFHFIAASSYWSNKEIVELLLSNSANVNSKTSDGYMPLHWGT